MLFFPLFKLQPQLQLLQSSPVHCILGILELNDLVKNCSKLVEKYLWDRQQKNSTAVPHKSFKSPPFSRKGAKKKVKEKKKNLFYTAGEIVLQSPKSVVPWSHSFLAVTCTTPSFIQHVPLCLDSRYRTYYYKILYQRNRNNFSFCSYNVKEGCSWHICQDHKVPMSCKEDLPWNHYPASTELWLCPEKLHELQWCDPSPVLVGPCSRVHPMNIQAPGAMIQD